MGRFNSWGLEIKCRDLESEENEEGSLRSLNFKITFWEFEANVLLMVKSLELYLKINTNKDTN